jgi:hypothetical protein
MVGSLGSIGPANSTRCAWSTSEAGSWRGAVSAQRGGDPGVVRPAVAARVARVALERPDGLLIERLLDGGLAVVAVHPNQAMASRFATASPVASQTALTASSRARSGQPQHAQPDVVHRRLQRTRAHSHPPRRGRLGPGEPTAIPLTEHGGSNRSLSFAGSAQRLRVPTSMGEPEPAGAVMRAATVLTRVDSRARR